MSICIFYSPSEVEKKQPSYFPTQILCAFLVSTMQATRPTHISILYMIPLIILLNITTHETLRRAIFFVLAFISTILVQIFPLTTLHPNTFKTFNILTNKLHLVTYNETQIIKQTSC
jgi:signal transduction histidine kinase